MYVDVALPIAQGPFTFELPSALAQQVECGCVVAVHLGERRRVGGVVVGKHNNRPPYAKIRPVEEVLFERPMVTRQTIELWCWMADYYMCTLGEVVRAALPSLIKPAGLTDEEFRRSIFRPREVDFVRIVEGVTLPKRARKQIEAAELIRSLSQQGEVRRATLAEHGVSYAVLRNLQQAGAIEIYTKTVCSDTTTQPITTPTLSEAQKEVFDALEQGLRKQQTALLQGVAGSGKTEIVMTLAARALAKGHDVLWLVPEMSLSSHFAERLRRTFGDAVVLYHSGLTERRRAEIVWSLATSNTPRLVVGVRSSVLLPLRKLGVVVVDEEYDNSYKQTDTAPRYSARDCAIVLAAKHRAKTILCAATPSMESLYNAFAGKYLHIVLDERWGGATPPKVVVSDVRSSARRGERQRFFNMELRDAIQSALDRNEQTILFQERRGTASYVECSCGWIPRCDRCNISLAQHGNRLRCHYCGRYYPLPEVCPRCNSSELQPMGTGTQQIEQYAKELYPNATVERLDRDSASSPARIREIIHRMESHQTDILVGTRLVTKGFDFEGVTVTGILNADNLLSVADFRASERALQTIMQAAGRAGRRTTQGVVVIQTANPTNPIIVAAAQGNYIAAARNILDERCEFNYPPYCRMIQIEVRSEQYDEAVEAAQAMARKARLPKVEVLGPQPLMQEGYGRGHAQLIILKIDRSATLSEIKQSLLTAAADTRKRWKKTAIVFNVDPQ
ncbi:MAG: primosomal protein N' [Rikenellaceae bacterium]|nr:primosomal protein N' [Rikenellaceae bacterium]